jgi:hypothetical protein
MVFLKHLQQRTLRKDGVTDPLAKCRFKVCAKTLSM